MRNLNLKFYDEHGFFIYKNFLNKSVCNQIKLSAKKLKPKLTIPFSKIPLGYGDLRDKSPFNKILTTTNVQNLVDKTLMTKTELSHFLLVNKAAWIGPDVEWHQEVFNMDIYAPGVNKKKDWKRFIQVFIAIDPQTKENGCLKVFDKSHKAGILKYEDIVNIAGSHKRRVRSEDLNKLHKKSKIIDIELKQGDALFFNHLLVHGSTNNLSPHSRLTALLQYYDSSLKFNSKYHKKYSDFRANFIENFFKSSLNKIQIYKKNLKDFKK